MLKKKMRSEKGQVLVFSILLLPLVLGILALLVEMGNLYVHYWQLQSAADITAVAVTRNITSIAKRREVAATYREVDAICKEVSAVCRIVPVIYREHCSEIDFDTIDFDNMTDREKLLILGTINDFNFDSMTEEEKQRIVEIANGINFVSMTEGEKTLISEIAVDFINLMTEGKKNLILKLVTDVNFDSMSDDEKKFIKKIFAEIDFDRVAEAEEIRNLIVEIADVINITESDFIAEIVIDHSYSIKESEITNLIAKIADNINFKDMSDDEKEFIAEKIVAKIDIDNISDCTKEHIAKIAARIDFDNMTEDEKDDMTEDEKKLIKKIANMSNMDNINENFPIKSFKPSEYPPDSNKFYVKLEKNVESFFERVFDRDGIPLPARAAASIDTTNLKPKLTPITKPEIDVIEPPGSDVDNWRKVEVTP